MIQFYSIAPGITLRCIPDNRFKQSCLSIQLVRPMCREEAAMNALLPAVLLRGCRSCPDLRAITLRLDEYYGASVGAISRRVGDYQTTGLYCAMLEDRFAMAGDAVLSPMADFLKELLLEPVLEQGVFRESFIESEKKNLISTIETQRNDKRFYAMEQLIRHMCSHDSFGIPRLGEPGQIAAITALSLYDHYQKILQTSRAELMYVGSAEPGYVAELAKGLFAGIRRDYLPLNPQTSFQPGPETDTWEQQEVSQGKLCMGFTTGVTIRDPEFAAMQVLNLIFGGGMTSKLFAHIREKLALCYAIDSAYHGSKGILTVAAGIDSDKDTLVREQILAQLDACCRGDIRSEELAAAKESLRAGLQATHDSPGSMESYYATAALSGLAFSPEDYIRAVETVTVEQVAAMARKLKLHSVFFLKGVSR